MFVLFFSTVRERQGMSPTKRPSPDRQNTLYSSHLKGMERPARSFKSFVRATPPHTSPNKPLPPIPAVPPLQKHPSSSSTTTVQIRNTGLPLWEAPSNWDNDDNCQAQSTPPCALRHYSPLIPEPPEDIAAMQADPILWQQDNGPFQQTPLDPIHERTASTPEIPPRNPSRLSLLSSTPATTRKNSRDTLPSVSSRHSPGTHHDEPLEEIYEPAAGGYPSTDLPSALDLISALSDVTSQEKALKSLGLGSPRDQGMVWGGLHQRSDPVQLANDSHLDLQGNKLTMFRKGSILADGSPVSPEDPEISHKVQALSFTQDYHNVLADRSFDDHVQSVQDAPPRASPEDRDLTPQPLTWRKESGSSPPAGSPQCPQMPPTSPSGRYKNLRKMSSWVNHHLRRDSQTGVKQRSTSDPEALLHSQLPEFEVDPYSENETCLGNIVQHGKDLVSHKILRRQSEPKKPLVISLPLPQQSSRTPEDSSVSAAPFELATPVFRLPGGLAVVRQSPLSTPQPQTASDSPSSLFSDLSWPDFPDSSQPRRNSSCCGSWQSSEPQPQTASTNASKRKFSSPLASPSILRLFSYSMTSLASSLPQEVLSPYSPPQTRRRSHNVGSPLTAPPSSHGIEQHTEESVEGATHKLNLFEKAKHARDVWKKHQKEMKNEKLKESIRLVGPADAKDIAGFIKCTVDGRVSGDSGIDEGV